MVKLIIFDWDGTLFDSLDGICKAMLEAGSIVGAPIRKEDDVKNVIGLGLFEAVTTVWPNSPDLIPKIIENYRLLYVANEQVLVAYDGVFDVLNDLKSEGYLLAVATGKTRRGLDRVMGSTGIQELFDDTRCADETLSKPHPLMLEELLGSLGVSADQAVMVGDTEYDLEMASNAKVKSIGVSYGAHARERLYLHNPIAVVDRFTAISEIIRSM